MCYDTVSTYDTTTISFFIYWCDTSAFCMHVMHDTSYDTPIVGSLRGLQELKVYDVFNRAH
jgi:hypothetical protein